MAVVLKTTPVQTNYLMAIYVFVPMITTCGTYLNSKCQAKERSYFYQIKQNAYLRVAFCTNGALDPWASLGILRASEAPRATVLYIPDAAHHLDLMPTHPSDSIELRKARQIELQLIRTWVKEWHTMYSR
ncbi:unnamed protein product [Protopolystoma xenopodis]|uniref:Uncharacterized protein n=1 Tax=Protopolystoma xenopodis TaxID=117903 RepID=A0A448WLU1_9PLAT|nr:unnamed protein product [Protopolystoma xenopodis]